jgi:hypothetical protein
MAKNKNPQTVKVSNMQWNSHCGYCRTTHTAVADSPQGAEEWRRRHECGCEGLLKLLAKAGAR